jgi:photosystem II stability/assembly factor-like uncharacterized protein
MPHVRTLGLGLFGVVVLPAGAIAHGGTPRVVQISFPEQSGGGYWAITDNQGLYAGTGEGVRWLCEDSVTANAGFLQAVPVGDDDRTWLVATNFGLHRTEDGGCNFSPVGGALEGHLPVGLWVDPARPGDVLTATQTPGRPNDVFRTEDGGRTWSPAGLAVEGIIHDVLRAPTDAARVWVSHARGAARSVDGGRTFEPMPLGPPELGAAPEEFRLLAGHPLNADEVWATIERFPDSTVLRSRDGGQTFTPMLTLGDTPGGFVFDPTASRALLISRFDEFRRSEDGGETWTRVPETLPLLGCLVVEPRTGDLWGCSNVFFMGPWVLGRSTDFGETWTPVLSRFSDVRAQWGCAANAQATVACEGLCPGQAAGAVCDLADAGIPPGPTDAERYDLSLLVPIDAGTEPDADEPPADATGAEPSIDAFVTPPAAAHGDSGSGCALADPRSRGGPPWALGTLLATVFPWVRRRRHRPATEPARRT